MEDAMSKVPDAHSSPLVTGEGVRTTCPYCGVGCGVIALPDGNGGAAISGDQSHPANFGRLCSKGLALGDTLGHETRVLHPMMRRQGGQLEPVSWGDALDAVASGFQRVLDRDGPGAIAFYLSGQLLTEDYYVANKLMKGFLGSANVDTNSRLCMASSVAGHKRAFGADVVPGCYDDLDEADLIVLVGSNAAWCHPVLFKRMLSNGRGRGARIVVIDPRKTATGEEADLFLGVAPGMDAVLFSGLLAHLAQRGKIDTAFVEQHTEGLQPALAKALEIAPDLETFWHHTRIPQQDIALFFDWFANTERIVTCYSQGVNQSAQGTDKVNAIINCHLVSGRIGKPGMGPFSLTGQPNAMGGREVGGLANQLAAHMGFSEADRDRVRRFWKAPMLASGEGLKAVDMFEAIEQRRIKALWVMGTNPVVSLPRGAAMARALGNLEHFVVSDNVRSNDTINAGAHILLPAAAWGEKDGTVTNSERRISRQRPFLPRPDKVRPDWWIVSQVARRMGFGAAFSYESPVAIFREHAALSAFENNGSRAFDLSGVQDLEAEAYEDLEPFHWPLREKSAVTATTPQLGDSTPIPENAASKRLFADGKFFTSNGKARFIAIEPPALAQQTAPAYPLTLNTGRSRDQWHTMTRTGLSPRLADHTPEPVLEIHAIDAGKFGLSDQGFVEVSSEQGHCILRVAISGYQTPGSVFAYIHWNAETASAARISNLVAPLTDPYSGQPELKATPCTLKPFAFSAEGFCLSRNRLPLPAEAYWASVPVRGGILTSFAMREEASTCARLLTQAMSAGDTISEYHDEERGIHGGATFHGGALAACFFVASNGRDLPETFALKAAFEEAELPLEKRPALLSGKAIGADVAGGATVCSCFGVRAGVIRAAIEEGCADVFALGQKVKAGTNCGSCQPELKRLIASTSKIAAEAVASSQMLAAE